MRQVSFASRPGLVIKPYCLQDFAPKLYCLQVLHSSRVNVGFTSLLITQEFRRFKISKLCYIWLTDTRLWPEYLCAPALANKQLVWDSNSHVHHLQLLVSLCFLCSLSYFFLSFGLLPLTIFSTYIAFRKL